MNGPRICTQPCNARRHTCCRAAAPHLRPTRKNASRKRRRDARDNVANVGPPAIGSWAGGEQMVVGLLRLRFAAGVCVLAAGLLMGAGGAVAVADPGSSGSAAHGDHGTNASRPAAFHRREKAEESQRKSLAARTARVARVGNQASSLPPARIAGETSLAARTPRTDEDSVDIGHRRPRCPVRSGRRGSDEAPARGMCRRFPIRSPRFRMRWRRFPMWWRRFPMCGGAGSQCGRASF